MSVKLITKEEHRFGKENVLPFVGLVKFSEQGIIEVRDENLAKALEEALPDSFQIMREDKKEDVNKNEKKQPPLTPPEKPNKKTPEVKSTKVEKEKGVEEDERDLSFSEILKGLELKELQDLAKDFPAEDWKNLTRDELVNYLQENI